MNRTTIRKRLCLFLAMVLMVGSINFPVSTALTNDTSKYDKMDQYFTSDTFKYNQMTWAEFKTYYGVPAETKLKNTTGWFFNIELWLDRHIVAYGDYTKIGGNDFKNATLNGYPNGGDLTIGLKNKGYYRNAALIGEYRYHGYDANGNKYLNLDFPADSDSGRKPEQKKWIYRVWDKTGAYYTNPKTGQPRIKDQSEYFEEAIKPGPSSIYVRSWIEKSLPFDIISSTNATDKDAYNYVHVATRPTTRFPGEGQMYHDSGTVFYQGFTLNKQTEAKLPLENKAFIYAVYTGDAFDASLKPTLTFDVKVTGILRDNDLYSGQSTYKGMPIEVAKSIYYTREDIKSWTLKLYDTFTKQTQTINNVKSDGNRGTASFKVSIPYEKYKGYLTNNPDGSQTISVPFEGEAIVNFYNNLSTNDKEGALVDVLDPPNPDPKITFDNLDTGTTDASTPPVVDAPTLFKPVKLAITAPKKMLDTEFFKINDATELPIGASREVYLGNDKLSDEDADLFLSGQYLFPLLGKDKIYTYTITYHDSLSQEVSYHSYIAVYTTKAKAQFFTTGSYKENRKISVTADYGRNSSYLRDHSTFTVLNFEAVTDIPNNVKYRTKTSSELMFLVKNTSELKINMKLETSVPSNLVDRTDIPSGYFVSDDFDQSYYIEEDYKPVIVANIWSTVLIRGESLDLFYEGSSFDNDLIIKNDYKIYYDDNKDSIPEKLIKQGAWPAYTGLVADKLGTYKIVFDIEEAYGQETLPEFITVGDTRKSTVERYFYVDNVSPVTGMETDIEVNIPKVDLMVLNDQGITRELNNAIKESRVNWINKLQQSKGVSANLQIWDLFTYTEQQPMTTSKGTGGSYPPATWDYTSGGFQGTLNLINVRDNGYWRDDGYWDTYTTYEDTPKYKLIWNGNICGWEPTPNGPVASNCYVEDGYTRVYTTHKEWVEDETWVSNYTGDYTGTLTKQTKQTFNPTLELSSNKYIVYFTNSTINNPADLAFVKTKATSKVILVSDAAVKPQTPHYAWIDRNQTLDTIIEQINAVIENDDSLDNKKLLLVNQTFNTYFMNFDQEKDSILNLGLQYVHDPSYYDNNTGLEANSVATYSDSNFKSQAVKTMFSKSGKFTIYSRIKDLIAGFEGYEELSNIASLDIHVHRKPIADFTLDWDFDTATSTYRTTWVDKSYDLDHQHTDAQKGIRDRKIMYRKTSGENLWIYAIPDNLTIGTYELRYTVKDIEGVWSDEITRVFTLSAEPPMRIEARLKATDNSLTIQALPASEGITIFENITRYHRAHSIKISLINVFNQTLQEKALLFSTDIPFYNINGNSHKWSDTQFVTGSAYPDGDYNVKIVGTSLLAPSVEETLYLPFKIVTPISISGELGDMTAGEIVNIRATTNKYAKVAAVTLFSGTEFSQTVSLAKSLSQSSDDAIVWEASYLISNNISEGDYAHLFTAWTDSGKSANDTVIKWLNALVVESLNVQGYWNHWRGQIDIFGAKLANQPHRFLSYEKISVTAMVRGNPDKVELTFSPELEAMQYINSLGQRYKYIDEIGYEVVFPLNLVKSSESTGSPNLSKWTATYILPLCRETLSYDEVRRNTAYWLKVEAHKGSVIKSETIADIDMTGNIYDLLYTQPSYK